MSESLRAIEDAVLGCLLRGEAGVAVAQLSAALDCHPNEGRLWELLGIAQWELGAVQKSIASLEAAMTLVPLGADAALALALGYEVAQKRGLARGLLVDLACRKSLPTQVLEPLSRALGRANEPSLALAVCCRASRAQPDDLGPLMGVVFYMGRLGKPSKQMLPPLLRALGLAPEDFSIRILAARCLHDCGLSCDAAELLRVTEYIDSCCPSCLHAMHEIFAAAGDEQASAQVVNRMAQVAAESQRT